MSGSAASAARMRSSIHRVRIATCVSTIHRIDQARKGQAVVGSQQTASDFQACRPHPIKFHPIIITHTRTHHGVDGVLGLVHPLARDDLRARQQLRQGVLRVVVGLSLSVGSGMWAGRLRVDVGDTSSLCLSPLLPFPFSRVYTPAPPRGRGSAPPRTGARTGPRPPQSGTQTTQTTTRHRFRGPRRAAVGARRARKRRPPWETRRGLPWRWRWR